MAREMEELAAFLRELAGECSAQAAECKRDDPAGVERFAMLRGKARAYGNAAEVVEGWQLKEA